MGIIVGLVFIYTGFSFVKRYRRSLRDLTEFRELCLVTDGVIVNYIVQRSPYFSDDSYMTLFIEFRVDGKLFVSTCDVSNSFFEKGESVKVFYNKNNVKDIRIDLHDLSSLNIFNIAGYLSLVIGVAVILHQLYLFLQ